MVHVSTMPELFPPKRRDQKGLVPPQPLQNQRKLLNTAALLLSCIRNHLQTTENCQLSRAPGPLLPAYFSRATGFGARTEERAEKLGFLQGKIMAELLGLASDSAHERRSSAIVFGPLIPELLVPRAQTVAVLLVPCLRNASQNQRQL